MELEGVVLGCVEGGILIGNGYMKFELKKSFRHRIVKSPQTQEDYNIMS